MARSPIMAYFVNDHLPLRLRNISQPFVDLAERLESTLPANAEKSTALRKLLESKDCAVRAALATPE